MERYTLIRVGRYYGVSLWATDDGLLQELLDEVKSRFRNARVNPVTEGRLPTGEVYTFSIERLDGKDDLVLTWLIKIICERGGEPFDKGYDKNGEPLWSFRIRRQSA